MAYLVLATSPTCPCFFVVRSLFAVVRFRLTPERAARRPSGESGIPATAGPKAAALAPASFPERGPMARPYRGTNKPASAVLRCASALLGCGPARPRLFGRREGHDRRESRTPRGAPHDL